MVSVSNFTPLPRYNYRVGVPQGGRWREILNSDAEYYGGSGMGNQGGVEAQPMPYEDLHHSLTLTLPPLALLFLFLFVAAALVVIAVIAGKAIF